MLCIALGGATTGSAASLGGIQSARLLMATTIPTVDAYSMADSFGGTGSLSGRLLATNQSWSTPSGAWSVNAGSARTSNGNVLQTAILPWESWPSRLTVDLVTASAGVIGLMMHGTPSGDGTVLRVSSTGVAVLGALAAGAFTPWTSTDVGSTGNGTWALSYAAGVYSVTYGGGVVNPLTYVVPAGDRANIEARTRVGMYASRGSNSFRFDNFSAVTL